jgi:DNA-binding transcriptional MocR family regulator
MKKPRRLASKLAAPPQNDPAVQQSKHRRVFDHLLASIQSGELKPGDRLPSEAELGKLFDASRITVAKAVHDLSAWAWSRDAPERAPTYWPRTGPAAEHLDC